MSNRIKYILIAFVSLIVGYAYYSRNQNKKTLKQNSDLNKTSAVVKDGKYFLVFNSIVVLTKEITKDQYNSFLMSYPSGKANSNVIDKFSTPNESKYITQNGKYYEYKWDGTKYINAIEITMEEFDFLTKKIIPIQNVTI